MPRCPKCGGMTEYLICRSILTVVRDETVYVDDYDELYYDDEDYSEDELDSRLEGFYCPNCDSKLFDSDDEAYRFLKKDEPHDVQVESSYEDWVEEEW